MVVSRPARRLTAPMTSCRSGSATQVQGFRTLLALRSSTRSDRRRRRVALSLQHIPSAICGHLGATSYGCAARLRNAPIPRHEAEMRGSPLVPCGVVGQGKADHRPMRSAGRWLPSWGVRRSRPINAPPSWESPAAPARRSSPRRARSCGPAGPVPGPLRTPRPSAAVRPPLAVDQRQSADSGHMLGEGADQERGTEAKEPASVVGRPGQ